MARARATTIKQFILSVVGGVAFCLLASIVIFVVMENYFKVTSYDTDSVIVFISIPLGATLFLYFFSERKVYQRNKSKKIIGNLFVGLIFGLIADVIISSIRGPVLLGVIVICLVVPFAILVGYNLNLLGNKHESK